MRDRIQAVLLAIILFLSIPTIPILIPAAFFIPGPPQGTGHPLMLIVYAIPLSIIIYTLVSIFLSPYFLILTVTQIVAAAVWYGLD